MLDDNELVIDEGNNFSRL